jgi:PhnO protein
MAKTIRPAAATDAGVIYELMCQLEDTRFDRAAYNVRYIWQLRNGAFHGLVLTGDAVVCGLINVRVERQLHHEHPVAEICELVADAAHRGSGCGTYLFDAALDVARNLNCEVIEVDSNNVREGAHRFYEARGMCKTHVKLTMPV